MTIDEAIKVAEVQDNEGWGHMSVEVPTVLALLRFVRECDLDRQGRPGRPATDVTTISWGCSNETARARAAVAEALG